MKIKIAIAAALCTSPVLLAFLWGGKEGVLVFLSVIAAFAGIAMLWGLAHWAIETVLIALGFDKTAINADNSRNIFIFWS